MASGRRRDRGRGTWRRERRVTRCTGRIDTYRSYHAAWLPMWSNKRVKGRCAGRCVPRRRGSVYFGGDENSSSGTSKSIATSLLGQKRAAGRARKKRRLRARVHVPGPLLFRPFSTLSVSTRRADDGAKTAGAPWRDRSLAAVHRRLIETPFAPTEKHRELAMSDYGSDHEDDTEHTLANVGFPRAWTILL